MKKKLPRYTTKYTNKEGEDMWSYRPPKRAIQAGAVTPLDVEASVYKSKKAINDMNFKLDAWKQSVISQEVPTENSTLYALFRFYQTTFSFNKLRDQTKRDYINVIHNGLMTKIEGATLANVRLKNL